MNKENNNALLKGALIIALGGFFSKLIGALYRIPLTNIIGSKGIGIYQLVFPLYSLLLTISSTGIPQSLSKLVAERQTLGQSGKTKNLLISSLVLFGLLGIVGSILMAVFAGTISKYQGEPLARLAYIYISPSVFLVSIISCLRGYFQGISDMRPTAFSQVIEQLFKLSFGLFFALVYRKNVVTAASYSCLAVTISEFFALIFLLVLYKNNTKKNTKTKFVREKKIYKTILVLTIPVTVSSILIPISQLVDSLLIINIVGKYSSNATALYGLFSGGVMTIISLPVAVCYGIAAALIPLSAKNYALSQTQQAENKIKLSINYTFFLAVPSFLICQLFSKNICGIIFGKLSTAEILEMSKMLKFSSLSILFLSLTQTLSACHIARGKPKISAIAMLFGVIIKVVLEIILLKNPKISVSGAAISAVACYFVASAINLVYIIKGKKNYVFTLKNLFIYLLFSSICLPVMYLSIFLLGEKLGFLVGATLAGLLYLWLCSITKLVNLKEIFVKGTLKNDLSCGIRDKSGGS